MNYAKYKHLYWLIPMVLLMALVLLRQTTLQTQAAFLEEEIKAELGQLDGKSNDEIQAALDEIVEKGSLHISINAQPIFLNGSSEGDLKIENHPNNHYTQRVTITLNETGQVVYRSGPMPVDSHIDRDRLDTALAQGQYPATALFTAYDSNDREVGQAAGQILLTILS